MNIVQTVLANQVKENFKSTSVDKHLECKIDLGYLMCSDPNDIDHSELKTTEDTFIINLTRDNVQLIVNDLWEQPIEKVEETIVAKLPESKMRLPRSRKIPDVQAMTKWEKFAKEKGIKKKKPEKKIFDQELQKWVPAYGFKKAEAEKQKEWVLELPQTADPMEDQFSKKNDLRSEKVAKNEIQRMKNIARIKKQAIVRSGYVGPQAASSRDLETASVIAKASTASLGKFQQKLSNDKDVRGIGIKEMIPGFKRKNTHLTSNSEKSNSLNLVNSILNKKPKLDIDKAVQSHRREEKIERDNNDNTESNSRRRSNKKNIKNRKLGQKPKGGKGNRNTVKRSIGRKRR